MSSVLGTQQYTQGHRQILRRCVQHTWTCIHNTHTCSPNLYLQQSESLQEGGKTKVGGRSRKPGLKAGDLPSAPAGVQLVPQTHPHRATAPSLGPPRPPQFSRSPPHLSPFNAAIGLERCCSPSRRAAGSLRGSHSSLQGWGLGNEEGLQSQG